MDIFSVGSKTVFRTFRPSMVMLLDSVGKNFYSSLDSFSDIGWNGWNSVEPFSCPLDRAVVPWSWMRLMWKIAFIAGSSKQGNAFLASVGCIWVVATTLSNNTRHIQRSLYADRCYIHTYVELHDCYSESNGQIIHLSSTLYRYMTSSSL